MVLLALLLIAAGIAAAVGLVLGGNTATVDLAAYGYAVSDVPVYAVFGAGAAAMFLVMSGVGMLRRSARRSLERRREIEYLRDEHEENLRRLEDENAALQQELEESRGRGAFGNSSLTTFTRADSGLLRGPEDSWRDHVGRESASGEFPRP